MNRHSQLHLIGNTLGLVVICFLLIFTFLDQFLYHDLPCPLCLLQRVGFITVGLCFCMNLSLGIKPSHYGLMILGSLLALGVSLRQTYIHLLIPNDPGYGMQFWGLHLYIWAAIGYTIILLCIAIGLLFDKGFMPEYKMQSKWLTGLMCLFLILILANGISTFIECGPYECPDNPYNYYLLSR